MEEVDDLRACGLGERADTSGMASVGQHVNLNVLLVVQEFKTSNARGAPWVDTAIDVNHLTVVVLEPIDGFVVQRLIELHVLKLLGQHDTMQVTLGRLDGEPLLEGLDVVAIVAQLTCGLHVE